MKRWVILRQGRAKEAARAYIKKMTHNLPSLWAPSSKRHHATKKSPAQLQREINEALAARSGLSKHHRYLLSQRKPSGGLRAGFLTPSGWHGDPMVVEDPKLRLAALQEQPAPNFPKDHSASRRSHSTIGGAKAGQYGYENGQRVVVLDYLGQVIGTGRVRSGNNYPESNEHSTWVTMTRNGETVTEEHPTRRVRTEERPTRRVIYR